MAQRYTRPVALERMSKGRCPECGERPDRHETETSVPAMFAPCNLLQRGVSERIAEYRATRDEESDRGR